MISEIDLKDWENVEIERFKKAVQYEYDWDSMPYKVYQDFMEFIQQVELIRKKQVKQVAVLLKGN